MDVVTKSLKLGKEEIKVLTQAQEEGEGGEAVKMDTKHFNAALVDKVFDFETSMAISRNFLVFP